MIIELYKLGRNGSYNFWRKINANWNHTNNNIPRVGEAFDYVTKNGNTEKFIVMRIEWIWYANHKYLAAQLMLERPKK